MAPILRSGLSAHRRRSYAKPGTPRPAPEVPQGQTSRVLADQVGQTLIDQVPADQVPADQVPADQVPADQVPADQAPADQAPADQAPADQAPADQGDAKAVPAPEAVSIPEDITRVTDILAWVQEANGSDEQEARAQAALDRENLKPEKDRRSTLLAELAAIILG